MSTEIDPLDELFSQPAKARGGGKFPPKVKPRPRKETSINLPSPQPVDIKRPSENNLSPQIDVVIPDIPEKPSGKEASANTVVDPLDEIFSGHVAKNDGMGAFEVKPFCLFSSDEHQQQDDDSSPPPSLEVLPSQVPLFLQHAVEPVNVCGLTLLKGRVSTQDVFHLSNSDLVPGKYEGGLKLWEGSLDLVKTLQSELQDGKLMVDGKRVLEIGCGHGLPGIFTGLEGADVVHFQDFNAEVLQCLTIPNLNANILEKSHSLGTNLRKSSSKPEYRFFAGDWREVHQILPCVISNENDEKCSSSEDKSLGYDIILMAETVYSISALPHLYEFIKKCLSCPNGVVYMAAKKYYFGVGGGSRQFLSVVEKDGALKANMVAEVADGSSNLREVWKLQFK